MYIKTFYLVLLFLIIPHLGASIVEIEQFSLNGSQNSIKALCCTGDIVWVGSNLGITKVKNKIPVFHNTTDNNLKVSYIKDMCSSDNVMWVYSKDLGVTLDGEDFISRFKDGKWDHWNRSKILNGRFPLSMAVDIYGACWIGTRSGIYRIDGEKCILHQTMAHDVKTVFIDNSNRLWTGGELGIHRFKILNEPEYEILYVETSHGDSMIVNETYLSNPEWFDLTSDLGSELRDIQSLISDKNENVWVVTYTSVFKGNASLENWSTFKLPVPCNFNGIIEAERIYVYNSEGLASISHTGDELLLESSSPENINTMLYAGGNIYVATPNGLLIKKEHGYTPVDLNIKDLNVESGLAFFSDNSNKETCIGHYTFRSGNWVKDDKDSGLVLYDAAGRSWFFDSKSYKLWNGSAENRKNILNTGKYSFEIKAFSDSSVFVFTYDQIWEFCEDTWTELTESSALSLVDDVVLMENGKLWIAGKEGLAERNNYGEWVSHTFPGPYINCMTSQGDSLWVASRNLYCLSNGKQHEIILPESAEPRYMTIDNNGRLWIATTLHGLYKFKNGEWEIFRTDNGIAENIIYKVHINNNDIWLKAPHSITRMRYNDETFVIRNNHPEKGMNYNKSSRIPNAVPSQIRMFNLKGQQLGKSAELIYNRTKNYHKSAGGVFITLDPKGKSRPESSIFIR